MMNEEAYNIAQTLSETAARAPFRPGVIFPAGRDTQGRAKFIQLSFQQLEAACNRYAYGLADYGVQRGDRTLLMVRPGVELIAVVFALLKIGAVPVLIDPGMGRKAFLQCVTETEPTTFIGIPAAHVLRTLFPGSFKTVQRSLIVGQPYVAHKLWTCPSLDEICAQGEAPFPIAPTTTESEAAVAFTSGSTGIPKGVIYHQGMFRALVALLRDEIGIAEGEVDLPGLYIFALFNPALGVTTVFPDMDPTKPAEVNPAHLVETIQTFGVTNSFGSPTIWKRVARYCLDNDIKLPSLKRILMAGAPVPPALIRDFTHILEDGDVYTPFGATEAMPLTMMTGREILAKTAALSEAGAGMCVGRPTRGNTLEVIPITDDPIPAWDENLPLSQGEIGEIVVKGPVVTRQYLNRPRQTAEAKIYEKINLTSLGIGQETSPNQESMGQEPFSPKALERGESERVDVWHRMGDLGYFDEQGRLWFCGRKSHRVETREGLLLPVPCEAIFNQHPDVLRTALVGVGPQGAQHPVLIVEPREGKRPTSDSAREAFVRDLLALGHQYGEQMASAENTAERIRDIQDVLFYPGSFPVDVRHNAKIQRRKLAVWASRQVSKEA
jgi:acyl-CoA synthetase (AMP-forming)/AMP-acid ligase II